MINIPDNVVDTSNESRNTVRKLLSRTEPTDLVKIDELLDGKMIEEAFPNYIDLDKNFTHDIINGKHSFYDLMFTMKNSKDRFSNFRLKIFDNKDEIERTIMKGSGFQSFFGILVVDCSFTGLSFASPLTIYKGKILSNEIIILNESETVNNNIKNDIDINNGDLIMPTLRTLSTLALRCFAIINDKLKNPDIKYSGNSESKEKVVIVGSKKNKKGHRKTCYCRVLNLSSNEVRNTSARNITCECWGVVGHRRVLPNGKITWVRPYTKGKKRHEKKNFDGIRERVLSVA